MVDYLDAAHRESSRHRAKVRASTTCGCFYCKAKFPPKKIKQWIDTDRQPVGLTALCPFCGIDAVIGDASGFLLTDEFLEEMHKRWFKTISSLGQSIQP